jgi:hypothetical protein
VTKNPLGFSVNGMLINETEPRKVLAEVLRIVPNLQYWAPESLASFIMGSIEFLQQYFTEVVIELKEKRIAVNTPEYKNNKKQITNIKRFITWGNNLIMRFKYWNNEEKPLIVQVYTLILAGEGQGILPGFSYSTKEIIKWKA